MRYSDLSDTTSYFILQSTWLEFTWLANAILTAYMLIICRRSLDVTDRVN